MVKKGIQILILCLVLTGCDGILKNDKKILEHDVNVAVQQIGYQVKLIEKTGKFLNPCTANDKKIVYIPFEDWRSGFFPGTMWLMYDLTKDKKWKEYGVKYTQAIDSAKYVKWHHDVGFMIGTSFGTGYRYTQNPEYKSVIVEAAKSLSTRFRKGAGVLQSWNTSNNWQAERGWQCPVIIDNMMNLEILFDATRFTGDSLYYKIAVSHADKTIENHFRNDFSSYHVVDYDTISGNVRGKYTAQGYSDESAWARGQAWALYGYTVCYRETHDPKYLNVADKVFKFIFTNKNMPDDLVPYWDFDAPDIPNQPRDVSAAAIMASALYELSTLGRPQYKKTADEIIKNLSGPAYLAIVGTNGNFLLMHSVGSIPHGGEIDVPLNYADYYFLEALVRKKAIDDK